MRIVCPSCSTAYTVPDQKIGTTGRKVRCARCGTRWQAMPMDADEADAEATTAVAMGAGMGVDEPDTMEPTPDPDSATIAMAADAAEDPFAAFADEPAPQGDAETPDPAAVPARPTSWAADDDLDPALFGKPAQAGGGGEAASGRPQPVDTVLRPRIKAQHRPRPSLMTRLKQVIWQVQSFLFRSRISIGVTIFLFALLLPAVAVLLRVPIVRAYPKIASLYAEIGLPVNLTGLEFRHLNTLRELENGQPVLVVEGAVANITFASLAMPGVRMALRGADGQEIYAWSVEPKTATVPAGDEVRFRSRLAAPPEEAVDIQLRFIEPKTRHAVLP